MIDNNLTGKKNLILFLINIGKIEQFQSFILILHEISKMA